MYLIINQVSVAPVIPVAQGGVDKVCDSTVIQLCIHLYLTGHHGRVIHKADVDVNVPNGLF